MTEPIVINASCLEDDGAEARVLQHLENGLRDRRVEDRRGERVPIAVERRRSERRRGRPKNEEEGSTISSWVSTSEHDQLVKLANKQRQSVSSLIRQLVRVAVGEPA